MGANPEKRLIVHFTRIALIMCIVFSISTTVAASSASPFVGHWQAIDIDESDIDLSIGGPPTGPFQITWTESYISFCEGQNGIVRGTGWLNETDSYLLEADLHLECFTIEKSTDFHMVWRYHPVTNTLSSRYENNSTIIIWSRPGNSTFTPAELSLRVNYGHDWVEGFYEPGHAVWVIVTDLDGGVRATTETITEAKDYWGDWEGTGFQTNDSIWFNEEGEQIENPPDIEPYDWVYAWVDNGASAQVQIGEINGEIDLNADSITGTINAPWFLASAETECLPWGSPKPIDNVMYGMVMPDNTDTYTCSWAGKWNILPYQDIGVGYLGPDNHWVSNVFVASVPQIIASESGNWFWTTGFSPGSLDLSIYQYEENAVGINLLWSDQRETDEGGFLIVDDHELDFVPGNLIVVSDGTIEKRLILQSTSVTTFDTDNDFMAGIAPAGSDVWAAAGPMEWQERVLVESDPITGEWSASFAAIGFDITEEMRPWSFSHIYDGDGDANEGVVPPLEN